eukprot:2221971-Amphidinium_carterae.1
MECGTDSNGSESPCLLCRNVVNLPNGPASVVYACRIAVYGSNSMAIGHAHPCARIERMRLCHSNKPWAVVSMCSVPSAWILTWSGVSCWNPTCECPSGAL